MAAPRKDRQPARTAAVPTTPNTATDLPPDAPATDTASAEPATLPPVDQGVPDESGSIQLDAAGAASPARALAPGKVPPPATQGDTQSIAIEVTAIRAGFRRAGRAFGRTPTRIDLDELTEAELRMLLDEPALTVAPLAVDAATANWSKTVADSVIRLRDLLLSMRGSGSRER